MRTFLKCVAIASAAGVGLLAAWIAVRCRSQRDEVARAVAPVREIAPLFVGGRVLGRDVSANLNGLVVARPAEEFPALANLQQVLTRLRSSLVAADLKLTPEQLTALRTADDAYEVMNNQYFRLLAPTTDIKSEMARFRSIGEHNKSEAEFREETLRILQPDQKRRLHEIMCRTYGLQIFEIVEIAALLGLSKEQRDRTERSRVEIAELEWAQIKAAGHDEPHTVTAESERIERERGVRTQQRTEQALDEIVADFSDEQKAAYRNLIGAPIDVATVLDQWHSHRYSQFREPPASGKNSGPLSAVPVMTTR